MTEPFFNGRRWRRILEEPEVKFLEALYSRTGSGTTPDLNLTEVNNSVTSLESQAKQINSEINQLRLQLRAQQEANQMLLSTIHKLAHRVNQLEDAQ